MLKENNVKRKNSLTCETTLRHTDISGAASEPLQTYVGKEFIQLNNTEDPRVIFTKLHFTYPQVDFYHWTVSNSSNQISINHTKSAMSDYEILFLDFHHKRIKIDAGGQLLFNELKP